MSHLKAKTISIVAASALAIGTAIPAFAEVPTPDVGDQSGTGTTTLKLIVDGTEYGGTEITDTTDPAYNPDTDVPADDIGNNLAFTVPTELDFVVKASGDLLCPSAEAVSVHNESAYGIHVSSVKVDAASGWNWVADSGFNAATNANTVSMNAGPAMDSTEKIALASYLTKGSLTNGATKWGMSAKGAEQGKDQLHLALDGKAKNLGTVTSLTTFGTIHWYLASGGEGTRYVSSDMIHTLNKPTMASTPNGSFKLKMTATAISEDLGEAVEGDTIYIVAEPESGYVANEMTVTTTESDEDVEVTRNVGGDVNVGSFTMPEEEVDIEVTFKTPSLGDIYTMSQLRVISEDIRINGSSSDYYETFLAYAENGETVGVTLGDTDHTQTTATLVDAHSGYGLVFMLDKINRTASHHSYDNDTNAGGWTASNIRTNIQSGIIYTTYLDGMTMDLADINDIPISLSEAEGTVKPASVTTYAVDSNGGSPQQLATENDTFFIPSMHEIYNSNEYGYERDGHQFAYFAKLGVTTSKYSALSSANGFTKAGGENWWLRSPLSNSSYIFRCVGIAGDPRNGNSYNGLAILPCFCL